MNRTSFRVTLALAAGIAAIAPAAQAQSVCTRYSEIFAAAPGGFQSLRVGQPDGDGNYESRLSLPGAGQCLVRGEPDYSIVACYRQVGSGQAASAAYDAALAEATACLPGWTKESPTGDETADFQSNRDLILVGQGANYGRELGLTAFKARTDSGGMADGIAIVFIWRKP
jgi:hypothetical protein